MGNHYDEGPHYWEPALNTLLEICKLRTFYWWSYASENKSFKFSATALRNLVTIVLNSDNNTEATLKASGKCAHKLQVQALRYEYETYRSYSYNGLKSICLGCPELGKLYIGTQARIRSCLKYCIPSDSEAGRLSQLSVSLN